MRKLLLLVAAGLLTWLPAPAALADHNVAGFWKSPFLQNAVCMARCKDEDGNESCDLRLQVLDSDGDVLQSQDFTDIPIDGNIHIIYTGHETPIKCFLLNTDGTFEDVPGDVSVALTRKWGWFRGLVDAMSIPD